MCRCVCIRVCVCVCACVCVYAGVCAETGLSLHVSAASLAAVGRASCLHSLTQPIARSSFAYRETSLRTLAACWLALCCAPTAYLVERFMEFSSCLILKKTNKSPSSSSRRLCSCPQADCTDISRRGNGMSSVSQRCREVRDQCDLMRRNQTS